MSKLTFLEFNEVFDQYGSEHPFLNIHRFIKAYGFCKMTHELHRLELWNRWVTAHTVLDADSHGIFRLGGLFSRVLDLFEGRSVTNPGEFAFQT